MKHRFVAVFAAIFGICVLCYGVINTFSVPNTISVNGECVVSAPKDRTAVTIRISVTDKSAANSMKIATAKTAEINEYLKTLDVRVQTSEFNSYEKTEWNHEAQKSEFVGIETNIALDVSANDVNTIENVLTKFAGNPDVYVTNLRMFTSNETLKPIIESCLGTAVENARMRADALAAGTKRKAGRLLSVSYPATESHDVVHPMANFRMAKATMDIGSGESYTSGVITGKDTDVSVIIHAVFEIR